MLFQGTFVTAFYRMIRDALHADAARGATNESVWRDLAQRAATYRSPTPLRVTMPA